MAVNNRLAPQAQKKTNVVEFEANGMKVTLTPEIVRDYLVSGNKEAVSINEVAMFMNLCKFNGLNPWIKEAYCIKYGNEPAAMVVGKEAFQKRAEAHPAYDGCLAGIIILADDGTIEYRVGTFRLPGEEIVGGFAEVFRSDRNHSTRVEVSFDEYAGRKKDGSLNGQWSKKPATMIRKVALVQALREAFPHNVSGMATAEEVGRVEPDAYIEQPQDIVADASEVTEKPQDEKAEEPQASAAASALFGN